MNKTRQTLIAMALASIGLATAAQAQAQTNAGGATYNTQSAPENVPANANGTAAAQARKTDAAEAGTAADRPGVEGRRHGRQHHGEDMEGPDGHGHGEHAAFMGRGVDRMIKDIGARPEQGEQIKAIMRKSMEAGRADHEQMQQLKRRRADLLKAATIDRAALESVRQNELQLFDGVSKRRTQAMADSAEVLTPEQRVKAADWMQSRRGPGKRRHGEHRGGEGRQGVAADADAGRPTSSTR